MNLLAKILGLVGLGLSQVFAYSEDLLNTGVWLSSMIKY